MVGRARVPPFAGNGSDRHKLLKQSLELNSFLSSLRLASILSFIG